jgi:plasmid stability protein
MPTLYVENVPDDLYQALREQAKRHRKSIAGEVITLLEERIPTRSELKKRRAFLDHVLRIKVDPPNGGEPSPSAEEMIREDRER